jgi:hypothetical protein
MVRTCFYTPFGPIELLVSRGLTVDDGERWAVLSMISSFASPKPTRLMSNKVFEIS